MFWFWLTFFGIIGVLTRYSLTVKLSAAFPDLPVGTFVVNLFGCLLIGFLYSWQNRLPWFSSEIRIALIVGLLGALTTFSSFALDCFRLWEQGQGSLAAVYWLSSNIIGLFACWLGLLLGSRSSNFI